MLGKLADWGLSSLIDPVLDPIGFGFMASLDRYVEVRRRFPAAEMMMGIGNLTELTAADSTGVNAVLIAICQELGIRTVLTTQVVGWARGAVREADVARRLMHYAVTGHRIPKGVDDRLVTLRGSERGAFTGEELEELQAAVTDANYRIFTDPEGIVVFNNERLVRGTDVQEIFRALDVDEATHAFYLGRELARAQIAFELGKTYRQDQALDWGYLTPPAETAEGRVRLTGRPRRPDAGGA
jgi:dihydropteroate synthase-like protein